MNRRDISPFEILFKLFVSISLDSYLKVHSDNLEQWSDEVLVSKVSKIPKVSENSNISENEYIYLLSLRDGIHGNSKVRNACEGPCLLTKVRTPFLESEWQINNNLKTNKTFKNQALAPREFKSDFLLDHDDILSDIHNIQLSIKREHKATFQILSRRFGNFPLEGKECQVDSNVRNIAESVKIGEDFERIKSTVNIGFKADAVVFIVRNDDPSMEPQNQARVVCLTIHGCWKTHGEDLYLLVYMGTALSIICYDFVNPELIDDNSFEVGPRNGRQLSDPSLRSLRDLN
ncbi:hypothetical protein RF11_15569 [Thelohanellus kitauei]|uniref:Uncharacterized protein n=1 Tax=Thelohanellus kitauei TaxID=669202 RepID=A0A0C2MCU0_THEKT|nr:hypothetical protein RF11_15569 [Thelohanellus kitauei]